jgi:cytochrome c peroxidase
MKKRIMKRRNDGKPVAVILFLAAAFLAALLMGSAAWGVFPPPVPTSPLSQIPVPEPPNLGQYVKNKAAAVKLGKALFWDMQVGSDGVVACATCHFHAGVDNRLKNTLNPGPDTIFGNNSLGVPGLPQFGPNYTLQPPADFPFHRRQEPVDFQASPVALDVNDVIGSQGVRYTRFVDIVAGSRFDTGVPIPDPVFNVNGVNTRRVTDENAPSAINAVFNYANFWDGRANNIFNGENPFGPADPNAGVWFNENGTPVKRPVAIRNASLASQATGPPLSDTEMSYAGRTFPQVGRKMLSLAPLDIQYVHPNDSVLGPLSKSPAKGLNASYSQMIKDAFADNLWNSAQTVNLPTAGAPAGELFSQMEANFSLFFGLAVQLYEATLVADRTPFDRFLANPAANPGPLTPEQKLGFNIFFGAGRCGECHGGTELTVASVSHAEFLSNGLNELVQFMFSGSSVPTIYDNGFYNIAVRPTTEDLGRGGTAPFTNPLTGAAFPLSFSRLALLQATGKLTQFATPLLPPLVATDIPVGVDGSFKTPSLRNVELTAPYFHNGGAWDLDQAVEHYNRGGNFPMANAASLHPAIGQIDFLEFDFPQLPNISADQALVAFLRALTDERVKNESAPFDHPELFIPEGDPEVLTWLPARDAAGVASPTPTLALNPVGAITNKTSQIIGGTLKPGLIPAVTVNGGTPFAAAVTGASWSATIVGLAPGTNGITVSVTDNTVPPTVISLSATIIVDTAPPDLYLSAISTPTRDNVQTLTGTVEAGIRPLVTVNTAASAGPVTVTGGNWSCQVSGLTEGANNITVTAADPAGNVTTRTAMIVRKTSAPLLSLDAVTSWTKADTQTFAGTVEAGITPVITVNTGAVVGPVTVTGSGWNCQVSGLKKGDNIITVTAADPLGNVTTRTATVKLVIADGCFRGTGSPDISDALKALRMAVGLITSTPDDLLHGDVTIDGRIDSADALQILRKVAGLPSF